MALRDYLNFESYADFADYELQNGQAVAIVTMDGSTPLETWYYNASSMAFPNGSTVFKPDSVDINDPGRYIKNMTASDWDTTLNKPVFADVATSGDYNDLDNKITAGIGIVMDNNEISVDDSQFMSKSEANQAIADMEAEIAGKTPQVRTITINGITQDLEANRDWEVGNLSSSASYSNPSWITSLSSSKITGLSTVATTGSYNDLSNKPTIPTVNYPVTSVNTKTGAVVLNASDVGAIATGANIPYNTLTGAPTIPTNTNQLTNGSGFLNQAGARSAISLTTTGTSGVATYDNISGVINIPNYSATIYTAGGGITISSGVISQTTPNYNNAPGRVLTTSFRPSTTRPTRVSYTVSITTAISLLNLNSAGSVALQISSDNINWSTINSAGITRTLSVSITVGLNETTQLNIQGEIPAGQYCRLLPTTSGGASIAVSSGQEVTY